MHAFIYSFNKYLFSAYYVLALNTRDTEIHNRIHKITMHTYTYPYEDYIQVRGERSLEKTYSISSSDEWYEEK